MGVGKAIAPNMAVFIAFDVFQNAFQAVSVRLNTLQYGSGILPKSSHFMCM